MELPIEFRDSYIQRRKDDLEMSLVSLSQGDYEKLVKIGHQIKGSAHTFGHERLAEIAERLEEAALEKDGTQVRYLLRLFSSWILSVT